MFVCMCTNVCITSHNVSTCPANICVFIDVYRSIYLYRITHLRRLFSVDNDAFVQIFQFCWKISIETWHAFFRRKFEAFSVKSNLLITIFLRLRQLLKTYYVLYVRLIFFYSANLLSNEKIYKRMTSKT